MGKVIPILSMFESLKHTVDGKYFGSDNIDKLSRNPGTCPSVFGSSKKCKDLVRKNKSKRRA